MVCNSIQCCLFLSSVAIGAGGVSGATLEATADFIPNEIGQGLSMYEGS